MPYYRQYVFLHELATIHFVTTKCIGYGTYDYTKFGF